MREILFRGKATSGLNAGKWVEGYFVKDFWFPASRGYGIIPTDKERGGYCEVYPATVGQYTGLTDENGKKIFEGDIVKDHSGVVYPVVFGLTGYYLKYAPPHSHGFHYDLLPLGNYWHAHGAVIEVIGNIHDNPELLEGCK